MPFQYASWEIASRVIDNSEMDLRVLNLYTMCNPESADISETLVF